MLKKAVVILLVLLLSVVGSGVANLNVDAATLARSFTIEDFVEGTADIIRVVVLEKWSEAFYLSEHNPRPEYFTVYRVEVLEVFKGCNQVGTEILVMQGEGRGVLRFYMPFIAVGQDLILFVGNPNRQSHLPPQIRQLQGIYISPSHMPSPIAETLSSGISPFSDGGIALQSMHPGNNLTLTVADLIEIQENYFGDPEPTPPPAPGTILRPEYDGQLISRQHLTIEWLPVPGADSYVIWVYRYVGNGTWRGFAIGFAPGNLNTSFTINPHNLQPGQNYRVSVTPTMTGQLQSQGLITQTGDGAFVLNEAAFAGVMLDEDFHNGQSWISFDTLSSDAVSSDTMSSNALSSDIMFLDAAIASTAVGPTQFRWVTIKTGVNLVFHAGPPLAAPARQEITIPLAPGTLFDVTQYVVAPIWPGWTFTGWYAGNSRIPDMLPLPERGASFTARWTPALTPAPYAIITHPAYDGQLVTRNTNATWLPVPGADAYIVRHYIHNNGNWIPPQSLLTFSTGLSFRYLAIGRYHRISVTPTTFGQLQSYGLVTQTRGGEIVLNEAALDEAFRAGHNWMPFDAAHADTAYQDALLAEPANDSARYRIFRVVNQLPSTTEVQGTNPQ